MSHHDVDPGVDPIGALRVELARVEVSPGFADRVRRQIGEDVISSIGAELSEMSVSPEFAVRVRQQIESAPARSGWLSFLNWRWMVPVAAAAAIAAVALTRGVAPATTGVGQAGVQARGPLPQSSQVTPAPQAPSITLNAPGAPVSPAVQIAAAARVTQRTTTRAAASGQQADQLEVITDQPAMYRRLWAAAAAATVTQAAELPVEVRDVAVTAVEVGPVVVQWLVEPPVSGGGAVPNVRRVSAVAERSDK
jgi:hypothetical protein